MKKLTSTPSKMVFMDHVSELRQRLIRALLFFSGGTLISYSFSQKIFDFLAAPLRDLLPPHHRFIYTDLTQGFFTHLRIGIFGGFILSFPFIMREVWQFISPGLYKKERRLGLIFLGLSPVLFLLGGAMAYTVVFPLAWKFFLSFEVPSSLNPVPIQLEASIDQYLSLVTHMILAFGMSFQLPILLTLCCKLGMMTPQSLRRYRRHGIVGIFIIAAIVTPPDVFSQIALALPLIGLYELALILIWFLERSEKKQETPSA
jgi:sec-independent protein translocase protein TatC